jgi:hypothetical protein
MCEKVFAYFFRRHVSKKFQEEGLEEHLRKMVIASEGTSLQHSEILPTGWSRKWKMFRVQKEICE